MLNLFKDNPFFILGIYSNSKLKERTSHISKIKAYANVGKQISFPLDFSSLIESPERNNETIEKSLSIINSPKDCFLSYLFWFSNVTSVDEVAINHAIAGDFNKAIEILEKQKKVTSIINLSIIYYLTEDFKKAIETCFYVIHSDELFKNFIAFFNESSGYNLCVTKDEISEQYINNLLKAFNVEDLFCVLRSIDLDLSDEIAYINELRSESLTKEIDKSLSEEKYEIDDDIPFSTLISKGKKINSETDSVLRKLINMVGKDSHIAEDYSLKIATFIRDCAVHALHNKEEKSDDIDLEFIESIESLIKIAHDISLSDIFKSTCEQDFNNLKSRKEQIRIKEYIDAYVTLCKRYERKSSRYLGSIFEDAGDFVRYAIPLVEKISPFVDFEIKVKLHDQLVGVVLTIINESFGDFNKSSDKGLYELKSFVKGCIIAYHLLGFLCDKCNNFELITSSQIRKALFSNANEIADIAKNNQSSPNFYLLKPSIDESVWNYYSGEKLHYDFVRLLREEKLEKKRKEQEEEERRKEEALRPKTNNSSSSSSSNGGGCYIATLVYGDYEHPKVKVLRHFRDNVLLTNYLGKKFVKFYYRYSPGWVQRLKNMKRINNCIRFVLNGFVYVYKKIKNI